MKTKSFIIVALAMVAALSMVSCQCNSKKTQKPTQEEVQQQKQALADSVLAEIDAIAEKLYDASSKSFRLQFLTLTDKEKLVKPDYLLDPSIAYTLVNKTQKINALAIYCLEKGVRKIYDMPCEEVNEAIAKLAIDLNFPMDMEYVAGEAPLSEKMRKTYETCKERGEQNLFWQFEYATFLEINYVIANDPELFFNKITEEQWVAYYERKTEALNAIKELAKYDEEMALLWDFRNKNMVTSSEEEREKMFSSFESSRQLYKENKDRFSEIRNALLQ